MISNKSALNLLYIWLGVVFVWIGAYFLKQCYPDCCPLAWAGAISAGAMWVTAGNLRDILRH